MLLQLLGSITPRFVLNCCVLSRFLFARRILEDSLTLLSDAGEECSWFSEAAFFPLLSESKNTWVSEMLGLNLLRAGLCYKRELYLKQSLKADKSWSLLAEERFNFFQREMKPKGQEERKSCAGACVGTHTNLAVLQGRFMC